MYNLKPSKVLVIFIFLITANGVFAMSLNNAGKVCLFSSMTGSIKLDGVPVANARLIRTVDRNGERTDETTTDKDGYFEFPGIFERAVTKFLPQEFVVSQEITVVHNEKNYRIWVGVKRKPEENAEAKGRPLIIDCELNSEKRFIQVNGGPIMTFCTWDVEADVIDTGF